jgi:prophage antirepressor-like protein
MIESKRWPCPRGCHKTFSTKKGAQKHVSGTYTCYKENGEPLPQLVKIQIGNKSIEVQAETWTLINNTIITRRSPDWFINLTQIFKSQKRNYNGNVSTYVDNVKNIKKIADNLNMKSSDLLCGIGGKCTWCHPKVALYYAQKLSPKLYNELKKWIDEETIKTNQIIASFAKENGFKLEEHILDDSIDIKPIQETKEIKIDNIKFIIREDNYINATQLCHLYKKKFKYWMKMDSTRVLLKKMHDSKQLLDASKGRVDSYIHPKLGIHLATWIDPNLVQTMAKLTNDLLKEETNQKEEKIEENNKKSKEENDEESNKKEYIKNPPKQHIQRENNIVLNNDDPNFDTSQINLNAENTQKEEIKEIKEAEIPIIKEGNEEGKKLIKPEYINQLFKFEDKQIRVLGTSDKPYFVAKDIAEILEYKDSKKAIEEHVNSKDKFKFSLINKGGCFTPLIKLHPQTLVINEAGFYSLIFSSKLPKAQEFREYVFSEILPTIRKKEIILNSKSNFDNKILTLNGINIIFRHDGYVNATQLCKAGNKKFNDWNRLDATQQLVNELVLITGIPVCEIIESIKGHGSWVHPKLAPHLAMWLSPSFALKVSDVINELLLTGDVKFSKESMPKLELKDTYTKQKIYHIQNIERINTMVKCMDVSISDYNNQLVVYLIHIGKHRKNDLKAEIDEISDEEEYFKFGHTKNIINRFNKHRLDYGQCHVIKIWKCINREDAETEFRQKMEEFKLIRTLNLPQISIKPKNKKEIIITTLDHPLDKIVAIMDKIASKYNTTKVSDYNELKHQLELQKKELEIMRLKLYLAQKNIQIPDELK